MKLSLMDEQEIRTFAKEHETLIRSVIGAEAEDAHREDHFFGEAHTVTMFLGFAKSLAEIMGGAVVVAKILTKAEELFTWTRKRLSRSDKRSQATLAERILILTFEAYANRKAGVRPESLCAVLGVDAAQVDRTLADLEGRGVVRKARDGAWRYVRLT